MLNGPWRKSRGLRKKPDEPKSPIISGFREKLKSYSLMFLMYFLLVANLIFLVSIMWRVLSASGRQKIPHATTEVAKAKHKDRVIQVEILNGCGVDKLADKLRWYLIDKKYDVVNCDNYQERNVQHFDIPSTLIIDRKYLDMRHAAKIAQIIGVKSEHILYQESPERNLDVSIIIGADYKELKVFK